ncbi:hypothetical protein J6590_016549 [Homalodisca vitripennis]|nr:hypothetical protein J6590_016549 [Homalodisca vitripennis]
MPILTSHYCCVTDADCLLDGESMEEQLMLESLIFNEQAQNSSKNKKEEVKKAEENVNTKERDNVGFSNNNNFNFDAGYLDEASGFDDGFSLEGDVDEMLIKQQEQLLEEARRFKELQRGGSNRGGEDKAKEAEKLDRGQPAAENASKNASPTGSKVVVPNEDVGIAPGEQGAPQQNISDEEMDIEKEKQRLLARLAMLMSKPAKTTVPQGAKSAKTTVPQEAGSPKTTAPQETGSAKTTVPQETGSAKTTVSQETGSAKTTVPQETGSAKTTVPQETRPSQTPVPQQPKPVQSSKPPEVLAPIKPASCVLKSPTYGKYRALCMKFVTKVSGRLLADCYITDHLSNVIGADGISIKFIKDTLPVTLPTITAIFNKPLASSFSSSMGRPTAMHLSLKGLLRTPEAHHEAYQSMISAVPQTAENNLSGPPGEIHYPCPKPKMAYRSLAIVGQSKSKCSAVSSCSSHILQSGSS